MSTYAIGDVQGCLDELQALLRAIAFDPAADRLIFLGDLVNRGPQSLETLRFIQGLGEAAITLLGNHDLHLLALALTKGTTRNEALQACLVAKDREEWVEFLRHCVLLYHCRELDITAVHAGVYPQWSLEQAMELADEAERGLRGPRAGRLLSRLYGNRPDRWSSRLGGPDRWRFLTMTFTRMRYLKPGAVLDFSCKQVPSLAPEALAPWYAVRRIHHDNEGPIVFGHWSTLGTEVQGRLEPYRVYPIDTGCVWGGWLSALRLDALHMPEALIQVPCSHLPEEVH